MNFLPRANFRRSHTLFRLRPLLPSLTLLLSLCSLARRRARIHAFTSFFSSRVSFSVQFLFRISHSLSYLSFTCHNCLTLSLICSTLLSCINRSLVFSHFNRSSRSLRFFLYSLPRTYMCLEIVNNLYIVSLSTHHVHTIIQSLNRRKNGDNYNHDRVVIT